MVTIILTKTPLHVEDLPQFASRSKSSVDFVLKMLSSILSIGYDSINHLSFAEFMCDPHRCPEQFYINRSKESDKMLMTCFRQMKDGLKFNICNLETSHVLNRDIGDLSEQITSNISRPVLYSCHFGRPTFETCRLSKGVPVSSLRSRASFKITFCIG